MNNSSATTSKEDLAEKKRNERSMMRNMKLTSVTLKTALKEIERINKIQDDVIRYQFVIRLLMMLLSFGKNMSKEYLEEEFEDQLDKFEDKSSDSALRFEKMETELLENYDQVFDQLDQYFENMLEWIASPIYSPDHPFMKGAIQKKEKEFQQN